jgi:hypothetical protein
MPVARSFTFGAAMAGLLLAMKPNPAALSRQSHFAAATLELLPGSNPC